MLKRKQNKMARLEALDSNEKLLNGFAWLSAGLLLSRLIGAIYIIFWSKWIGEHYELANSLYAIAYNPYVLFIDIATAGFPMAITKQVSQLNAQQEYKASMQLFKYSVYVMLGLGALASFIFYVGAPLIAGGSVQPTHDIADNIRVLRTLAPTLLILPVISILRGFFQGFQQMTTPAVSQIIEQFVRVGYMLSMTYYVMKIKHGSFVEAVEQSTLAAFVGAVVTLAFLLYEFVKAYPYIKDKMKLGQNRIHISFISSVKTVLQDSIPFVLLSMGTSLLAIIDQFLYRPVMADFSDYSPNKMSVSYAWFSANSQKLTSIVGSLTTALTTATIPSIAMLYYKKDKKELSSAVTKNINLYSYIIIPTTIGLFIVSNAIYRVFYGDANGAHVLRTYAIGLLSTGIFSIFVSMLQGMGKHMIAIRSLSIMLVLKIPFDIIFTAIFKEQGAGISNIFAMVIAVAYLWVELKRITRFNTDKILNVLTATLYTSLAMAIAACLTYFVSAAILPEMGFLPNLIKLFLTAFAGGLVYVYVSLKFDLMDAILPDQAAKIRRLLKMPRSNKFDVSLY